MSINFLVQVMGKTGPGYVEFFLASKLMSGLRLLMEKLLTKNFGKSLQVSIGLSVICIILLSNQIKKNYIIYYAFSFRNYKTI